MLGENFRKSIIAFYNLGFISAPYAPPPDCFFLIRFRNITYNFKFQGEGHMPPLFWIRSGIYLLCPMALHASDIIWNLPQRRISVVLSLESINLWGAWSWWSHFYSYYCYTFWKKNNLTYKKFKNVLIWELAQFINTIFI